MPAFGRFVALAGALALLAPVASIAAEPLAPGPPLPAAAASTPAPADGSGTVDLIVRTDTALTASARGALRREAGTRFQRRLRLGDTELVSVPAPDAAAALATLAADPDVRWAMRDRLAHANAAVTTDPLFGDLWGLSNTGQGPGYVIDADMDVPEAWPASTGTGVTVAVIDTGVNATHPDLNGQLATNPGETGGGKETNGIDDDGNGLVDDARGWNFIDKNNNPNDLQGHGTHVTGTIVARNGNGIGITGVAPDAQVLPIQVLDADGEGPYSAIADGFDLAGDLGIRIANASLGSAFPIPVMTSVIKAHPNTLYVIAAGNDGKNLETGNDYFPCEVPAANVLCVGASDPADGMAVFGPTDAKGAHASNYGETATDVFAPGASIRSTLPVSVLPTGYGVGSGTSMASPNVAGVAALVLARNPALSTGQLKEILLRTVDRRPGLRTLSAGRVNAQAAVAAAVNPLPEAELPVEPECRPSASSCVVVPVDSDRDGVVDTADRCPTVPGPITLGGCAPALETASAGANNPLGTPPPAITSSRIKLSKCAKTKQGAKKRACQRRVSVAVAVPINSSVRVTISARVVKKRKISWKLRETQTTSAHGVAKATVRFAKALPAGRYRAAISASAGGAFGPAVFKSFSVKR